MREFIYSFIWWVAGLHERIISINDSGGYYFDDKQLHFIVVGLFGMVLIFVLYPIFKLLAKTGHTMVITWLYVFTVVIVVCFAIEIGQWYSGTGLMESEDIAYGITGFLVMFFIFAILRGLYHGIKALTKKDERKEMESARHYSQYGDQYDGQNDGQNSSWRNGFRERDTERLK